MKNLSTQNIKLISVFAGLVAGTIIIHLFFTQSQAHPKADLMYKAAELCQTWFTIVEEKKQELSICSDAVSNVPNKALIGNDWSEITTTLGTLEAKELTTNPDFAALMVKLICEAGMQKGQRAGVMLSGSFPALAIATFAALQTMEMDAVVISSLGASSFGANQPRATWLDYENWLTTAGGFKFQSSLITCGAENDNGGGMMEEGIANLELAAKRNNAALFIPVDLQEAIRVRVGYFEKTDIDLLINIGGGQAAVGSCVHNLSIPNGLTINYEGCRDHDRGVISRVSEQNIPFIHLLNLKDLAMQNGIPIAPGKIYSASIGLYDVRGVNKIAVSGVLLLSLLSLAFLKKSRAKKIDGHLTPN